METVSVSGTGSSGTVTLWDYLQLMKSTSNDSAEGILQTLWRTRRTGLGADDRSSIINMLQLENDSDLDPVRKFQISHSVRRIRFYCSWLVFAQKTQL